MVRLPSKHLYVFLVKCSQLHEEVTVINNIITIAILQRRKMRYREVRTGPRSRGCVDAAACFSSLCGGV